MAMVDPTLSWARRVQATTLAEARVRPTSYSSKPGFGSNIDLGRLGNGGIRIDGGEDGGQLGTSVAGAGDFDGDGRSDVIVGAWQADYAGRQASGSAYVVFSRPDVFEVDTAALGLNGVQLGGSGEYQWTGQAVAGAGDINGDGRSDVVVGSPAGVRDFSSTEAPYAGSAAVVFGR